MKHIEIVVDMNDADYCTKVTKISDEDLVAILPLIDAISKFKPYIVRENGYEHTHYHNYPWGEYLPRTDLGEKFPKDLYPNIPEDVFDLFEEEFIPYGEHGFHTIKSVRIFEIVNEKKLFEHKPNY